MDQAETSLLYTDPTPNHADTNINTFVETSNHYSLQRSQLLLDHKKYRKSEQKPVHEPSRQTVNLTRFSADASSRNNLRKPASPQTQSNTKSSGIPSSTTFALNFSARGLKQVPRTIESFTRTLNILDLSDNKFTEIPPEILALNSLKTLKMDHNRIKALPAEISALSCLETLSISHNFLTEVTHSIEKLRKTLIFLNISHNHIEQIPPELTRLSSLKVLYINNNNFTALPITLDSLQSLKELSLEWFKYTNPPRSMLQNDKNRTTILKLFDLCKTLQSFNKSELNFEEFVTNFSESNEISLLNTKDSHSRNILHITALEEEVGIVKYLLSQRGDLINELDQEEQTPLSLAIREEKYSIAQVLLSHRANPQIGGGAFGSCLHMAVTKLQVNLVSVLLKHGAKANARDYEGNTPLYLLCCIFSKDLERSIQIAEMLINSGADPNSRNSDGWGPIHQLVRRGHLEGLQWIMKHNYAVRSDEYKKFDLNLGGADKWTPLHLAANVGNLEMAQLLVENGADINETTKSGHDILSLCQHNILMSKLIKKLQKEWIDQHFFQKSDLQTKLREISLNSNVHNLKKMICNSTVKGLAGLNQKPPNTKFFVSNGKIVNNNARVIEDLHPMKSEQLTKASTMPEQDNNGSNSSLTNGSSASYSIHHRNLRGQGKHHGELTIITDNSLDCSQGHLNAKNSDESGIYDVDECVSNDSTKDTTRVLPKSPNNIQKLQIAQSYRNYLARHKNPNPILSSPSYSKFSTPTVSFSLRDPIATSVATTNNRTANPAQKLAMSHEFDGYIRNFDNYTEEIKNFQNLVLDNELPISERLRYLFYLKVIHLRINQSIRKFHSDLIPLELFITNEYIEDELKKKRFFTESFVSLQRNGDVVPRALLFIFENLDSTQTSLHLLLKMEICRIFGDVYYATAKFFIDQLIKNSNEKLIMQYEAKNTLYKIEKPPTVLLNLTLTRHTVSHKKPIDFHTVTDVREPTEEDQRENTKFSMKKPTRSVHSESGKSNKVLPKAIKFSWNYHSSPAKTQKPMPVQKDRYAEIANTEDILEDNDFEDIVEGEGDNEGVVTNTLEQRNSIATKGCDSQSKSIKKINLTINASDGSPVKSNGGIQSTPKRLMGNYFSGGN